MSSFPDKGQTSAKDYVNFFSANHNQTRIGEIKSKIEESNVIRKNTFRFPQPAYDRFYSWIIAMTVMIVELEEQEYREDWKRLQHYVEISHADGIPPAVSLEQASESTYFSRSGQWAGLIGKMEMLLDTLTALLQTIPEKMPSIIRKFEVNVKIISTVHKALIEYDLGPGQQCLTMSINLLMEELRKRNLYKTAIEELKLMTVPGFGQQWTPRMGTKGQYVQNNSDPCRRHFSICAICQGPAQVPYDRCRHCGESPSFHHGRCCPALTSATSDNADNESDVWGKMTAISAQSSTSSARSRTWSTPGSKSSSSAWAMVNSY